MEGGNLAHTLEGQQRTSDVVLREVAPFDKMLLAAPIRKGLQQAGFIYPTVIQATAIPVGKSGLDLLVQSKSGTGKTLIFSTILLEAYDPHVVEPQALIVAPTREIAVQIESVLNMIGHCCSGFRAVSVIGGIDIVEDRKRLQGAKAVVGTPGRLLHVIENKLLNTARIKLFVMDEADKLYTQSFRKDLQRIQYALSSKRQTIACSATFCGGLDEKLAKIMRNPLLISTEERATLLVGIKQFTFELAEQKTSILEMQSKLDSLRDIFGRIPFKQCLIFAGSQSRATSYRNYLEKDGWPCDLISGAQDQQTRLEVFHKFREFKTRIVIATDLMSRGVDSKHVNLVINLELPTDVVTYLHRIGRAGRFGSHGIAISFIASEKDRVTFKRLITEVGSGMNVLKFPQKGIYDKYDFWNFDDLTTECQILGLYGQESVAPLASNDTSASQDISALQNPSCLENSSATLSHTQEDKENKTNNIFDSPSIDTKTFNANPKNTAYNIHDLLIDRAEKNSHSSELLTPNSHESSPQQVPSSNTTDNSSSSSEQDILQYQSVHMLKATSALVDFLVDQRPQENEKAADAEGKEKPYVNVFEDYRNAVLESEQESNTIENSNNIAADSVQSSEQDILSCQSVHMQNAADNNNDFSSIDTKTFKEISHTQELLTPDSHESSPQQLPSSNTIDNASSIAADSGQTSEQDILQYQSLQAATSALVDFLVDQRPQENEKAAKGKEKLSVNVFEDYRNAVIHSEEESPDKQSSNSDQPQLASNKLLNLKSLLIDKPQKDKLAKDSKQNNLYSDYANFNKTDDDSSNISATAGLTKSTFILPTVSTSNSCEPTEEMQNSSLDLSQFGSITESPPEKQRFQSSAQNQHAGVISDVVPPIEDAKDQELTINVAAQVGIPPYKPLNDGFLATENEEPINEEDINSPSRLETQANQQEVLESGSSTERGASASCTGYNENTTSASSDIETSETEEENLEVNVALDDESSSGDDNFDYFGENLNGAEYTETDDEYETDSDHNKTKDSGPSNCGVPKSNLNKAASKTTRPNHSITSQHSKAYKDSAAYKIAYKLWVKSYKQQVAIMQNYANICAKAHQNHGKK